MAEPDFERAVEELVLSEPAPGKLLALHEHQAVVIGADHTYALIFRYLPGIDRGLGEHLRKITAGLKAGRLLLVLIGGGEAQQQLLTRALPGFGLRRKVSTAQWRQDGGLWLGPHTRAGHPLVAGLRRAAERPAGSAEAGLRQRLEAVVDPEADGRREMRAFVQRLRQVRPWAAWSGVGLCAVMFLLATLWGGSEYTPTEVRLGANVPSLVAAGQIQRLAASLFLHAGPFHLAMNMLVLWILGGFVERLLGASRLVILLCISGLAGSLASALLGIDALSVGASGALWGLIGAAAVLAFWPLVELPAPLLVRLRRDTVMMLILNLGISFLPRIDMWAHLGGGLAGALLVAGRVVSSGADLRGLTGGQAGRRPAWLRPLAVAVAAVTLAGLGWAVAEGRAWELTGPVRPSRVELADSGVSLEVPALIAGPPQQHEEGPRREFVLGDLRRDPLLVAVELAPATLELGTPERLAEELARLKQAREEQPIPEATRRGAVRQRSLGGVPTIEELFVFPGGARYWRYSQLRPGLVITVSVLVLPGGPPQWSEQVEPIVESLKSNKPLRVRA